MPDLLIEIGCEELPASACREAIAQVPGLMTQALAAARLPEREPTVMVAPRRIAVFVPDLPEARDGRTVEVRGPAEQAALDADGNHTKAAEGFARAQGVEAKDLVLREDGGRRYVFAVRQEPAADTAELMPELARAVLEGIRFGKNMRWGDGEGLRFSRPVRWLVAKLGSRTVEFELQGLRAGGTSRGHRFLGGPAEIADAAGYREALRAQAVVADHAERRTEIVDGLDREARRLGVEWSDPGGKLEEVLFLVERPGILVGDIKPEHLRLPERVLITAMQSHQRYFPLRAADGTLQPRFLSVSNGDPAHGEVIAHGNASVLDARLQDAAFSFDRDREAGLPALNQRLATIVFHKRLGTMADKRDRLEALAFRIAADTGLDAVTIDHAVKAASLAKADQGAVLVAEFSDLQGEVAAVYAELDGVPADVCAAVREHYLPEGPDSPLPSGPAGAVVALAEKLDNLTGAFLVNEVPSGSKDPYALRRAAAGVVRLLLDRGWDTPHAPWLSTAAEGFRGQGANLELDDATAIGNLEAFIGDRLAYTLAEEGVGAEASAAAQGAGLSSLVRVAGWARAIQAARGTEAFTHAWTACTRLVKIGARAEDPGVRFASVGDAGEDALAAALAAARAGIEEGRAAGSFTAALDAARPLADAVDRFFTDVLVNADDPAVRARRYALVNEAAAVLLRVADFTKVTDQGGER
ncbi:MAG: glycine--tRNA ligase subunit beta [Thermoleophilia bacterium]